MTILNDRNDFFMNTNLLSRWYNSFIVFVTMEFWSSSSSCLKHSFSWLLMRVMKYQLIEVRRDINTSPTNNVRTLSAILFMIRAAPLLPGLLRELLWPALITEKPQSLTWANNTGLDLGLTGRPGQHHLPDVTNLFLPLRVSGMNIAFNGYVHSTQTNTRSTLFVEF